MPDIGLLMTAGPKRFICPACHRLHEWRALDGKVIDQGASDTERR